MSIVERVVAGVAIAGCVAACGGSAPASKTTTVSNGDAASSAACDNAGLTLPAGFCATVFADSVGRAREIVVAPDGDVYATLQGRRSRGAVVAMRDANHDGKADSIAYVPGAGNTGVGLYDGYLYVDEGTQLVRLARGDNELVPSGAAQVVISGIPVSGDHPARNFVIASDGTLLLNVGSATNACQERNRTEHSLGKQPCDELETRAGIWKYDAKTLHQTFDASHRYVTGIRNAMGLAFAPDGKLWATQHGRDQLYDNWPEKFTPEYSANNPAEELMQVNAGDDFGWPFCYYSNDEKKLVLAPEYGGDGKTPGVCAQKKAPVAAFPGHWAPMSLLFYTGSQFPTRYRHGAFISFHGSWNRAPLPQAGYRIVFQPLDGTRASGDYETFADGFAGGNPSPDRAAHRPVGLAQAPDGSLFVADDMAGRIYRITYQHR